MHYLYLVTHKPTKITSHTVLTYAWANFWNLIVRHVESLQAAESEDALRDFGKAVAREINIREVGESL